MMERNGDRSHPIKVNRNEKAGQKKPQYHILGGPIRHGSSLNRQWYHDVTVHNEICANA
jgi:hypothetical protein